VDWPPRGGRGARKMNKNPLKKYEGKGKLGQNMNYNWYVSLW
jgi:hypothetical protein